MISKCWNVKWGCAAHPAHPAEVAALDWTVFSGWLVVTSLWLILSDPSPSRNIHLTNHHPVVNIWPTTILHWHMINHHHEVDIWPITILHNVWPIPILHLDICHGVPGSKQFSNVKTKKNFTCGNIPNWVYTMINIWCFIHLVIWVFLPNPRGAGLHLGFQFSYVRTSP